jgi:hypothetical protein
MGRKRPENAAAGNLWFPAAGYVGALVSNHLPVLVDELPNPGTEVPGFERCS